MSLLERRSTVLAQCNKMTDDLTSPTAQTAPIDELAEALAALRSPAEVHSLAERWQVARLLDEGKLTYREIHDATGVSTTTIVRVARFLKQEGNRGYRLLLDRRSGDGR